MLRAGIKWRRAMCIEIIIRACVLRGRRRHQHTCHLCARGICGFGASLCVQHAWPHWPRSSRAGLAHASMANASSVPRGSCIWGMASLRVLGHRCPQQHVSVMQPRAGLSIAQHLNRGTAFACISWSDFHHLPGCNYLLRHLYADAFRATLHKFPVRCGV